jgi:UDP:flavonoid glycosyltransferase YjiC (YdhE family)
VENACKAANQDVSSRFIDGSLTEEVTRPAQEALIRAQHADAIVNDMMFIWNGAVADELGVPCVVFSVMGAFSTLAVRHLLDVAIDDMTEVPEFPGPPIRIPKSEVPEFIKVEDCSYHRRMDALQADCFGLAVNTSGDLEKQYCEMYMRRGYVKRAYFLGPLALMQSQASSTATATATATATGGDCYILDWLDSRPNRSVVYLSFGTMAVVKDAQLEEIALGLESSGNSFLWVVRGEWTPPRGWEERVQDRGIIVKTWAPQTAILGHPAVGAFVTQCGWNSILETVAAGVPVLTWPMFYEQFITERQVTQVLGIGERLWPDGAGLRSETALEHELVPAKDVARALTEFMRPGGTGDAARIKVMDLAAKLRAAVAQGGSSHRDLHRLIDDLMAAAAAAAAATVKGT